MSLKRILFLCPLVGLLQAASIPDNGRRSPDEGVRLHNGNNGWGSFGRGAMMWSGWGPRGMTAFTSTGGELLPPPQDSSDDQGLERRGDEGGNSGGETSRANANASFNAWFPIVLGMFPGSSRSGAEGGGDGWPPVAAIANSISHGARGVATSHAVAYGGPPPQEYRRNRSQQPNGQTPIERH